MSLELWRSSLPEPLTVKPVDGGLGGGGVVEGDGGLPLQLARVPVGVEVDHRHTRLLVDLTGERNGQRMNEEQFDALQGWSNMKHKMLTKLACLI